MGPNPQSPLLKKNKNKSLLNNFFIVLKKYLMILKTNFLLKRNEMDSIFDGNCCYTVSNL